MKAASWAKRVGAKVLLAALVIVASASHGRGQNQPQIVWTEQEKPIMEKIRTLRKLPDQQRARTTKELALQIRQLEPGMNKLRLAVGLSHLSTEGDFGQDTLQEVATTLAGALKEHPLPATPKGPPEPYIELASLVRYEHVNAALDDPQYAAAVKELDAEDVRHQEADFTLTDLSGKSWTLHALRGKVVLVNFWATWCPPCLREFPDLASVYKDYHSKGVDIVGVSMNADDEIADIDAFVAKFAPPFKLYRASSPDETFQKGVLDTWFGEMPMTLIFDKNGKLARTHKKPLTYAELAADVDALLH